MLNGEPHPLCSYWFASPIPFSNELLYITAQTRLYHIPIYRYPCFSDTICLCLTLLASDFYHAFGSRCTTYSSSGFSNFGCSLNNRVFQSKLPLKAAKLTGDELDYFSISFHKFTFCKGKRAVCSSVFATSHPVI